MKTSTTPLVLLLALSSSITFGADSKCEVAPYGSTQEDYNAAQPAFETIAKAIADDMATRPGSGGMFGHHRPKWFMEHVIPLGLRKACYAKFGDSTAARADYHEARINDQQIDSLSMTGLAIRYFQYLGYSSTPKSEGYSAELQQQAADAYQQQLAAQESKPPQTATPDYKRQLELLRQMEEREQQKHPGITLVYSLFQCVVAGDNGTCSIQLQARLTSAGTFSESPFTSLEECQQYAALISHTSPTAEGHYRAGINVWFECRSLRVDTWEPAR
jgi:hypothetical protein